MCEFGLIQYRSFSINGNQLSFAVICHDISNIIPKNISCFHTNNIWVGKNGFSGIEFSLCRINTFIDSMFKIAIRFHDFCNLTRQLSLHSVIKAITNVHHWLAPFVVNWKNYTIFLSLVNWVYIDSRTEDTLCPHSRSIRGDNRCSRKCNHGTARKRSTQVGMEEICMATMTFIHNHQNSLAFIEQWHVWNSLVQNCLCLL